MSGTRREWIRGAAAAGLAGTLGLPALAPHAEPPPETTVIRLAHIPGNRYAPQYVAEDLLRAEGFSDVRYVRVVGTTQPYPARAKGEIDLTMAFIAPFVLQTDTDIRRS